MIPESYAESRVTVPIKRVYCEHAVSPAELDQGYAEHHALRARESLRKAMGPATKPGHVNVLTANALSLETFSLLEHTYSIPARRRWWHRLLGLHPTETHARLRKEPGVREGAVAHHFRWEGYFAECPYSIAERVETLVVRPNEPVLAFALGDERRWRDL